MMKDVVFIVLLLTGMGAYAELRTWTLRSGEQVEAEYEKVVMDKLWLKEAAGKTLKIPLTALSEDDCSYIELVNPPELDIEFKKKEDNLLGYYKGTPYLTGALPPSVTEYSFRAFVKTKGTAEYHHELKVVYYAIGRQRLDRDKYILLEKKSGNFTPSEQAEFTLSGGKIKMLKYVLSLVNRGKDYASYLVVVTDERGKIIAHKESAKWLFEHLDKLEKIPVGAYMDESCTRVHPTGPKPNY